MNPAKRLHSVCLIAPDVGALRKFYQAVLQREAQGDETFVEFPGEGPGLALFSSAGMEGMAPGSARGAGYGGMVLEFEVADVDAEYARLVQLGVPIAKPPTTQPWGLRSVWFRDPLGNLVNFFARVKVEE